MLNSSENWPAFFNASSLLLSNWWQFIEKFLWIAPHFLLFLFSCPFVLPHYCCSLLLSLACHLLLMTVLYSPLFSSLLFVLFYVLFLSVFLFGYAPYCGLIDKKTHSLFAILVSPLSSVVLTQFPVLCLLAVHPSCFLPTFGSFNLLTFNFGSHFL